MKFDGRQKDINRHCGFFTGNFQHLHETIDTFTHLRTMFVFYTPWRHQKTSDFLIFPGGGGLNEKNGMKWVNLLHLLWPWSAHKWDKVFKNGPSEICWRQPLKNFTWSILEYFVPNLLILMSTLNVYSQERILNFIYLLCMQHFTEN